MIAPRLGSLLALALALSPPTARAAERSAARGGCPPAMVRVAGGALASAEAGDVELAPFCLDRTEVTAEAYARCAEVGACPAEGLDCGAAATFGRPGLGAHPVNCVTWDEADTFCRAHGKRLPSEDEWEWAAQNGAHGAPFPWGDAPPADRACWDGEGNAVGLGARKGTCPVGAHPRSRSAAGIQDLAGNVREWTATAHERFRVLRGGSWGDSLPEFLLARFRGWNAPDERMELLGFRCAAPIGAVAQQPVRRAETARAETDDAGVLILSAPIELTGSRRARR